MVLKTTFAALVGAAALALVSFAASAGVSAAEAATLGGATLTCNGGEKAGSASGVAAWTGRFKGSWPGVTKKSGYEPGPYADEKPLFTISARNPAPGTRAAASSMGHARARFTVKRPATTQGTSLSKRARSRRTALIPACTPA